MRLTLCTVIKLGIIDQLTICTSDDMSQLGSTIGKTHLKDGLIIISCLQDLGKNIGRSPAHSHSPAQNHVSAASSANQSPAGR